MNSWFQKVQFLLSVVAGILLLSGLPCPADETPPTLDALREKFAAQYACPGHHGLATFSAHLSSDQLTMIANKTHRPAPKLIFHFRSPEDFQVEQAETASGSVGSAGSAGFATPNTDLLGNFVQAIAQTAEGFFQTYLMVGFDNPFSAMPSSASIRIENERLVVEYPDQIPEHWVTLDFDPDFVLAKMETRDLLGDTRSVIRPIWAEGSSKRVLTGIHVEYFQGKYEQADFITRMKIENLEVDGFLLPARVVVQARDGKEGNSPSAIFDFRFDQFVLGVVRPAQRSSP